MVTAMDSIKEMVDVNTIIGEPIETSNNIIIIPISKVGFGFAAGGSEFKGETIGEYSKKEKEEEIQYKLPFGGGSGAGVSITPVAFLVVQSNTVKLLPVNHSSAIDKLLDYVPDLVEKTNCLLNKTMNNKREDKKEEEKRKEKEKREIREAIKQDSEEMLTSKVKPKKNKPMINYEYEYDEVDENDYDDED